MTFSSKLNAIRLQNLFMSLKNLNFTLILYFFAASPLFGQDRSVTSDWKTSPNILIETFNQNDGLPVVSLSYIVMGADGYLYIASYGGLSRFDGSEFELITTDNYAELPSNRLKYLRASPDSSIWIFDEEMRISRWKKGTITNYGTANGKGDIAWWLFKASETGSVWALNNLEAQLFDKTSNQFIDIPFDFSDKVIDIIPVDDNNAWVLTTHSFMKYEQGTLVSKISFAQNYSYKLANTSGIEQLKVMSNGLIAGFTPFFVFVFNPQNNSFNIDYFENPHHVDLLLLEQKDEQHLLLRTPSQSFEYFFSDSSLSLINTFSRISIPIEEPLSFEQNITLIDAFDRVFYKEYLLYDPGRVITSSAKDMEGNLWITVEGIGLQKISLNPFRTIDTNHGLIGNNAYSIVERNDNTIWAGLFDGGVSQIQDTIINSWEVDNNAFGTPIIRSLYQRSNNEELLASVLNNGLFLLKNNNWEPYSVFNKLFIDNEVTVLSFLDDGNTFWIGSSRGLFKKTSSQESFEEVYKMNNVPIPNVQTIFSDHKNNVWFGTRSEGLFKYVNSTIKQVDLPGFDRNLAIRDIYETGRDTLWLASANNGLLRVILSSTSEVQSVTQLTKSDGLPDVGVHRVLIDPYGYVWLPSNQGVSRIALEALNNYLDNDTGQIWIYTLKESNGLSIREANGGVESSGIISSDSTLWIPTQKGIIQIDPSMYLGVNPYKHLRINLNRVSSQQRTIQLNGEHTFFGTADERSLLLELGVLNLSQNKNLPLEYQIRNLNTGWQTLNSYQFNVANLPKGVHTLKIRFSDLPESMHSGSSFNIVIPPYYYEETWFRALLILLFTFLLATGFLIVHRTSSKKEVILNQKVMERTQELANQTEEIERLSQVKTDFFINITHELRTPLMLIKGPLQLLKSASKNQTVNKEEQLSLIERNSTKLNQLIDRLLNLLRLEIGDEQEHHQLINLVPFVIQISSQFESNPQINGKKYYVKTKVEEARILGNPDSLELIINNLISNSLKYTNKGDVIEISVDLIDSKPALIIEDSGIGIKKEDIKFIFDPFYRAKNTQELTGSGIGLSIVKNYLDQLGGIIRIDSELGKGTRIEVIFPKEFSEHTFSEYNAPLPSPELQHQKVFENNILKRDEQQVLSSTTNLILVVDDYEDIRNFLYTLLSDSYTILLAENGEQALEMLASCSPNLIISDVMMPKMDGISFIKELRSNQKHKKIPCILFSAKKTNSSIIEGLNAGAQVFLPKPIDNRILLAQIDALISREHRITELNLHKKSTPLNHTEKFRLSIDEIILRHLSDSHLTVDSIASSLNLSRSSLYRKWKRTSYHSLNEHITKTRLEEAIRIIEEKGASFLESARICGFSDQAYFSKTFKKHYGKTPTDYFKNRS